MNFPLRIFIHCGHIFRLQDLQEIGKYREGFRRQRAAVCMVVDATPCVCLQSQIIDEFKRVGVDVAKDDAEEGFQHLQVGRERNVRRRRRAVL